MMHGTRRVFVPSLISCLARESVTAVAGSEIYWLRDNFSVPRFAHDLVACYNYILVVVITYRGRLPPTESANSPTTRLSGLPIVIIR